MTGSQQQIPRSACAALLNRILIVRGPGRSARIAAAALVRQLEGAHIDSIRIAGGPHDDLRLGESARVAARSCQLVVAVGDARDRAADHALEYEIPLLELAATHQPDFVQRLAARTRQDERMVLARDDRAHLRWHGDEMQVAADDATTMLLRCGNADTVEVAGTASLRVVPTRAGFGLSVGVDGCVAECREATIWAVGGPLSLVMGTQKASTQRVTARVATLQRIHIAPPR